MARRNRGGRPRMPTGKAAERMTEIVRLRRKKLTFAEIGAQLDPPITGSRVQQIYSESLILHPLTALQIDEHRLEEQAFIDDQQAKLIEIMDEDDPNIVSARTKVEASRALATWSELRIKLLGLAAPTQLAVTTISQLDAEVMRLSAEMEVDADELLANELA
jgi:DNA repair ATPase RecN